MNLFSRDFTRTEKLLIALLALILLGLMYYQFVHVPVSTTITNDETEKQMLQTQIEAAQQRAAALRSLQNKLDQMAAEGKLSYMGSYNNAKTEVAFLNDLLADTLTYSIEFANVTRSGDQIRRSFKLRYQTVGFRTAREILERLNDAENRCVVGDVKCSIAGDGTATLEASATFFETMVGGTPDAGLPVDAAAANS